MALVRVTVALVKVTRGSGQGLPVVLVKGYPWSWLKVTRGPGQRLPVVLVEGYRGPGQWLPLARSRVTRG